MEAKLNYEVVIVDDSSPDNTLEVAEAIRDSYGEKHVTIVSRKGKLGLGTAYIAGLKAAKGDRIILMDADLSHHPKFIPKMVDLMDKTKVEIVTGTRYAKGGGVYGWDMKRKLTRYVSKQSKLMHWRSSSFLSVAVCFLIEFELDLTFLLFLKTKIQQGRQFLGRLFAQPGCLRFDWILSLVRTQSIRGNPSTDKMQRVRLSNGNYCSIERCRL